MVRKTYGSKINPELARNILRTVSIQESFLFFTDIDNYTGLFASSLSIFLEKLKNIPPESVEFHFKRRDFEKWIGYLLGDKSLANNMREIDRTIKGEKLRITIQRMVKKRLDQINRIAH